MNFLSSYFIYQRFAVDFTLDQFAIDFGLAITRSYNKGEVEDDSRLSPTYSDIVAVFVDLLHLGGLEWAQKLLNLPHRPI